MTKGQCALIFTGLFFSSSVFKLNELTKPTDNKNEIKNEHESCETQLSN